MTDYKSSQNASQMSTQSVRDTQELFSQSLDHSMVEEKVWGRLLPLRDKVRVYDLTDNTYSFGRGSVDHQFTNESFDEALLSAISKRHFSITRETISKEACIFIQDLSSNGTFLNQKKIGNKKKTVLKNNDEIGLTQPDKKVFMFHDCLHSDDDQYPEELTSKYTVTRKIGEGQFGEVRLAYKQDTLERCAVKILKKKILSANGNTILMNNISTIQNEVQLLQSIDHVCIVRLWDVIESDDRIYIVMELAAGGELFDRITGNGHLAEPIAKLYCYQLLHAIHNLHSNGITHRDIKPENILLSSEEAQCLIKLTDFGLSKLTADASLMTTFCGTQLYLAPELLDTNCRTYTKKVDLWSFGVVIFVCLAGYAPFYSKDDLNLRYLIRRANCKFDRPVWDGITSSAKDLIKHLLVADPVTRYDAQQTLQHPWFQTDEAMRASADKLMSGGTCTPTPAPCTPTTPTDDGTFARPNNKRAAVASPEARRRMQDAKTPRLVTDVLWRVNNVL